MAESLRDFLKGLELADDMVDTIMAEHGKIVTKDKETISEYKKQIADLNSSVNDLKKSGGDIEVLNKKIAELQNEIQARKDADAEFTKEKNLEDRFNKALGKRSFTNDYTKSGMFNDFKTALADKANEGKSDSDLFEAMVKDKAGIFKKTNDSNIPGFGSGADGDELTKEMFDKLSLDKQMDFANRNPEEYKRITKM